MDFMARLSGELLHFLLTPSGQGQKTEEVRSILRGLMPNWKVAAIAFSKKDPKP